MRFVAPLLVVTLVFSAGCAFDSVDTGTRTGGHRLELEVRRDGAQSIAIYRMNRDGTISYAGGKDALIGSTTWTGELTDKQIDTLVSLLHELQWYTRPFESTGEPPELEQSGFVRGPDGFRKFHVVGEHPRITPMREALEQAAARRLDPVLDQLPRPSGTQRAGDGASP